MEMDRDIHRAVSQLRDDIPVKGLPKFLKVPTCQILSFPLAYEGWLQPAWKKHYENIMQVTLEMVKNW